MRRIASERCGALGAMSRNLRYASIALPSLTTIVEPCWTSTCRVESDCRVGSFVVGRAAATVEQRAGAQRARGDNDARDAGDARRARAWPKLHVADPMCRPAGPSSLPCGLSSDFPLGAVVELREREARLSRIGGDALLLVGQLGDGDVLRFGALLAAQGRRRAESSPAAAAGSRRCAGRSARTGSARRAGRWPGPCRARRPRPACRRST